MTAQGYAPLPMSVNPAPSQPSRFALPLPWSAYPPTSSTTGTASFDQPTLLQAITARPLRLVAWGAALILSLLVISGSFGKGPVGPHIARIGEYAQDNFWATRSKSSAWRELPQNEGLLDPVLTKDERTGYSMPPDVYPAALNP